MNDDVGSGGEGGLSRRAVDAFTQIAAGADPSDVMPDAVAELEALGVIARDLQGTNRPVPLDPAEVLRRRLEAELQNAEDCIARMRALPPAAAALEDAYERSRLHAGGRSEYIPDPVVVNARLQDVVSTAQFEIIAAQPGGPRLPHQLEVARDRDAKALDRGVALRTLYRATVRDNSVTAAHARSMANRPAGRSAEFRTLEEPFERAIVVDRRIAFISNTVVPDADEHAAWQITDGAFVVYIVAEFEARWRRADLWHGELRARGQAVDTVSSGGGPGVRTTPRQRQILRDLVADHAQQATAQRLGISLRTLQGEIAELKSLFDVASVSALTYRWALSPDRMVDDSAEGGDRGGEDGDGLRVAA